MSDHGSREENKAGNSSDIMEKQVTEIQTLTQEAFNEQDSGFIANENDSAGAGNDYHTASISLRAQPW